MHVPAAMRCNVNYVYVEIHKMQNLPRTFGPGAEIFVVITIYEVDYPFTIKPTASFSLIGNTSHV